MRTIFGCILLLGRLYAGDLPGEGWTVMTTKSSQGCFQRDGDTTVAEATTIGFPLELGSPVQAIASPAIKGMKTVVIKTMLFGVKATGDLKMRTLPNDATLSLGDTNKAIVYYEKTTVLESKNGKVLEKVGGHNLTEVNAGVLEINDAAIKQIPETAVQPIPEIERVQKTIQK